MVQYKKFQLDSLFDIRYGKFIPKRKAGTKVPFVTTRSGNNGIAYYVDSKPMCKGDALTIASDGSVGETYYQDKPFSASNIVVIMEPHDDVRKAWTPQAALYLSALIKQYARAKYDWGRKYSVNRVRATQLELPVTPTGDPDFEYMTMRIRELEAERIRELEAERIRELEAYLRVTGLDDTTLSASEAQALTQKVQWKKFRIGDIFDIKKVRGVNKSGLTTPTVDDSYDYITRTSQNNGIESITGNVNDRKLNSAGTISLGLLQMTFFYRDRPWYAGQFVRKIVPKIELTKEQTLYFVVLFNALRPMLLGVLVRNVDETFLNTELQLPVTVTGEIDLDYMQNYICATEKRTIKGVVEYKDRVIEETKKVVGTE